MSALQQAIQGTIPRKLTARELYEAENNLVGLFDILLKINDRAHVVDLGEIPNYRAAYE